MNDSKLIEVLKAARKYVEEAGVEAEARHDDREGECCDEYSDWVIMKETERLMDDIDKAISCVRSCAFVASNLNSATKEYYATGQPCHKYGRDGDW